MLRCTCSEHINSGHNPTSFVRACGSPCTNVSVAIPLCPVSYVSNLPRGRQRYLLAGHRSSIARMICSAQRTASPIAVIVAGTLTPPSYCASLRAAKMLAAMSSTRLRPSSTGKIYQFRRLFAERYTGATRQHLGILIVAIDDEVENSASIQAIAENAKKSGIHSP